MNPDRVRFGIVVFPGSNCDHDAYYVAKKILGQDAAREGLDQVLCLHRF